MKIEINKQWFIAGAGICLLGIILLLSQYSEETTHDTANDSGAFDTNLPEGVVAELPNDKSKAFENMDALEKRDTVTLKTLDNIISEKEIIEDQGIQNLESYYKTGSYIPYIEMEEDYGPPVVANLPPPVEPPAVTANPPMDNNDTVKEPEKRQFRIIECDYSEEEVSSYRACIHKEQKVSNGSRVRIRLLEPIAIGKVTIPSGKIVTGIASITGSRIKIEITSIEYGGKIIKTDISVYDNDAQEGIYTENGQSPESNTARNIMEDIPSSISAAGGIIGNLINESSQYVSNKITEHHKIVLPADYKIILNLKQ